MKIKDILAEAAKRFDLKAGSLNEKEALAVVTHIIAETAGLEPKQAAQAALALKEAACINTSALRQKIQRDVFGITTATTTRQKESLEDSLMKLLES